MQEDELYWNVAERFMGRLMLAIPGLRNFGVYFQPVGFGIGLVIEITSEEQGLAIFAKHSVITRIQKDLGLPVIALKLGDTFVGSEYDGELTTRFEPEID